MFHSVSASEAVKVIKSNDRVYIHTAAAAPQELIDAMTARADSLRNVEVCHLHIEGEAPYANPELSESFHVNSLFIGPNVRHTLKAGNGSYTPVFLSEVPNLFRSNVLPIDVAMIQVSPPDKHGYCSLGISVEATLAAVESARHVIVKVNPQMPRTHGDGLIHISRFDTFVYIDSPIHTHTMPEPGPAELKIGEHIAGLIEDGSTLQMGIGAIPDAALKNLGNHKRLGIHTEMFSDGVIDLVESDVITGEDKVINPNRIFAGFAMGTKRLYDFIDDNPFIEMRDIAVVNDVAIVRQNPKVVAINSAIEVDLSGQVCSDSIGSNLYSGVGGQMDFIRGASLSKGGKPIIALPSVTNKGVSRIVPFLKPGAGVVTTRAHVHYIITEYGIAYLYGKTIRERVKALVHIAHPDHREAIAKEYWDTMGTKLFC
jgi:acyl-CoA hydrolase